LPSDPFEFNDEERLMRNRYRGGDSQYGERRAEYEWESVFYHAGADAMAGWEAYDFRAGQERDGRCEADGSGSDWTR
jgi:hypothetical protein